jgi:hypothetical protein
LRSFAAATVPELAYTLGSVVPESRTFL